jgi:AAA+ superfamily predicted ATPase
MNLDLSETAHPTKTAKAQFDRLLGMDAVKASLLEELHLLLKPEDLAVWAKHNHSGWTEMVSRVSDRAPVVLLSGDVGCGKSVLARSVATPLADRLDAKVRVFESPTDLRGGGHVGELSTRLTELFRKARTELGNGYGLLILDEADDIATRRDQDQAHHEDRAGVNVLIKQINGLRGHQGRLALVLITNRLEVLDPAVVRRAALHLSFARPDQAGREALVRDSFPHLTHAEIRHVAAACERDGLGFSPSDITERLLGTCVRRAWRDNSPVTAGLIRDTAMELSPSPTMDASPRR